MSCVIWQFLKYEIRPLETRTKRQKMPMSCDLSQSQEFMEVNNLESNQDGDESDQFTNAFSLLSKFLHSERQEILIQGSELGGPPCTEKKCGKFWDKVRIFRISLFSLDSLL